MVMKGKGIDNTDRLDGLFCPSQGILGRIGNINITSYRGGRLGVVKSFMVSEGSLIS
jgi:hypothetical protein